MKFINKENMTYIGLLLSVFLAICLSIVWLYAKSGNYLAFSPSGSDVANIFVASATLLGPLILVFTLNTWKHQHKRKILDDNLLQVWMHLDDFEKQIYEMREFIASTQNEAINRYSDYSRELFMKIQQNLLEIRLNLKVSLNKLEMINKTSVPLDMYRQIEKSLFPDLLDAFLGTYKDDLNKTYDYEYSYSLTDSKIDEIRLVLSQLLDK